jgi:hypothetical protein
VGRRIRLAWIPVDTPQRWEQPHIDAIPFYLAVYLTRTPDERLLNDLQNNQHMRQIEQQGHTQPYEAMVRGLAMLIEWPNPDENQPQQELEKRLHGTWQLNENSIFELQPGGKVGPSPHPSDRWMIIDAAAGKALLSLELGRNQVLLTTTANPHQLAVTLPDGSTRSATRHPLHSNINSSHGQKPSHASHAP